MIEIEKNDVDDDPRQHPTYAGLITSIYDRAISIYPWIKDQNVHFSAQSNDWGSNWSQRTGIPLTRFQDPWQLLKEVPAGEAEDACGTAANRRVGGIERELRLRAKEYLKAKPGHDNRAFNVALHGCLMASFRGDHTENDKLESILNRVTYRLGLMHEADDYVAAMEIILPSCIGFSVEDHKPTDHKKTDKAFSYLWAAKLFDRPPQPLRPEFRKPVHFLAIALAKNCAEESWKGKSRKQLNVCSPPSLPHPCTPFSSANGLMY